MKQPRNSTRWALAVAVAAMVSQGAVAETDVYGNEIFQYTEGGVQKTYKFWVSGTKAEIATKDESAESSSSSAALATGTYSTPTAEPISLEARFRTWLESVGIALRSDLLKGLLMIIK